MRAHLITAVALVALASGCQCGRNVLVDVATIDPGQLTDAGTGVLRFCGDAIVTAPEECDTGLEGGSTSECNSDCTVNRACPAGKTWHEATRTCRDVAFDAGMGAEIAGTVWEYIAVIPNSALHPNLPIKDAVIRLQLKDSNSDVGIVVTKADGTFRFAVAPNVAYQIRYELPDAFETEAPGYARQLLPVPPGGVGNGDYNFLRRGLHFAVRERGATDNPAIAGARVKIIDESMNVLAAERLTDAEGYVYFERTATAGKMVFEKTGFKSETLGGASVNTTHTVVGGMSLERE